MTGPAAPVRQADWRRRVACRPRPKLPPVRAGEVFGRVAAWAARHAKAVLAVTAVVAIAAGLAATRLDTDAGTDTLVDSGSASFQASEQVRQRFGDDPVVILAEGDLRRLVLTANLGRLLRLEGCLSGRPPKGVKPLPGPCTEIARMKPVKLVTGPATFLNQAVIGIQQQLGGSYQVARAQAERAGRAAAAAARAQGLPASQQRAAAEAAAQEVLNTLPAAAAADRLAIRDHQHPAARRPTLRLRRRL